jgi:D-alanine--D-alanine ligase
MYDILFVGILKNGTWKYDTDINNIIINTNNIYNIKINTACKDVFQIGNGMINNIKIECAFLATHGQLGEDGNLQGFLKINNIKYTGPDITGSVVCFNKNVCKRITESNDVKVVPYIYLNKKYANNDIIDKKLSNFNYPEYIVKINNGGSSFGVYSCDNTNILDTISTAFELDNEILIEEKLVMREISVGIINDGDSLVVSDVGECVSNNTLFSYDNKYGSSKTDVILPTNIDYNIVIKIKETAAKLYQILNLNSYSRIDFFLTDNNDIYFNEINTLPGLSSTSLFPIMFKNKFTYEKLLITIINNSI